MGCSTRPTASGAGLLARLAVGNAGTRGLLRVRGALDRPVRDRSNRAGRRRLLHRLRHGVRLAGSGERSQPVPRAARAGRPSADEFRSGRPRRLLGDAVPGVRADSDGPRRHLRRHSRSTSPTPGRRAGAHAGLWRRLGTVHPGGKPGRLGRRGHRADARSSALRPGIARPRRSHDHAHPGSLPGRPLRRRRVLAGVRTPR